jgi:hypothetical protein
MTSQMVITTPEVFRVRTVRDLQQLKADPNPVPVVGREFVRAERLLIRLSAYGPGGTTPALTARLLNRAGQAISQLPVAAATSAPSRSEIELALAPIPAGEYVIEISAKGETGEVQELIAFRVTG